VCRVEAQLAVQSTAVGNDQATGFEAQIADIALEIRPGCLLVNIPGQSRNGARVSSHCQSRNVRR